MTEDDYKGLYGLPWGRGLVCKETYVILSNNLKRRRQENSVLREGAKNGFEKMLAQNTSGTGPAKRLGPRPSIISRDEIRGVIKQMIKHDLTLNESAQKSGISVSTLRSHCNADKELLAELNGAWESISFQAQARAQRLGGRFNVALHELFDKGLSDHKAAALLGVTAMTCNKQTKSWRR